MSALDKALRQIDQQRRIRDQAAATPEALPEFYVPFEPVAPRTSIWMPVALVVVSLALVGTWLVTWLGMPGGWSVPLKTLADGQPMGQPQARAAIPLGPAPVVTVPAVLAPALPLLVAPTAGAAPKGLPAAAPAPAPAPAPALAPAPAPALPLLVTPTAEAAPKALHASESAKPGLVHPGNLFTYPAWHKGADRRWNWGLWEEASRLWLKGLTAEEPQTPMLMIADQLTQVQVNRLYAAWSPLMPVVALPKTGVSKKRWLLLAVPAAKDLARAQQLLRNAQGQEGIVVPWAQWQKTLGLTEGEVGVAAQPAQNMGPAPVTPAALPTVSSSVPRTALPPAAVLASPPAAARALAPVVAKAQAELSEPRWAQATQEAPQLSRTEAERLPASGPVPPTAKAIDADYQLIEKSLARGDHQAALDAANKLEKYIGENWRTQYLAGVALMGLSRWEAAIAALSKAQELNPRHATAALYLSVALQERGEHARAIQVLDKAQLQQPLSPELWLNQGHSHQALGHTLEARKAYNRFLELSVNRQDLAVQRVWVLNRLEKDKG